MAATTSRKDAVQRTGCAHQAARTGCGGPAGELHGTEGLISNQGALARFLLLLRPCRPAFTLSRFEFKEHGFPRPANLPWTKKAGKNGPTLPWTTHHCLHRPLDLLFSCLPRSPPPLFSSHHCPRYFTIQKLKDCSPQSHKHNNYTSNFPQI